MAFEVVATHSTSFLEGTLGFFLLLFFAVLAKIGFHKLTITKYLPESACVIVVGALVGGGIYLFADDSRSTNTPVLDFDSHVFFIVLIPPIILDAGYFLRKDFFIRNVGTILTFAVFGTLLSSFAVGISLFALRDLYDFELFFSTALAFGSLISAVDPVAVLAIFEEVHVNEQLDVLVFGESVLNDAVAIVLYNLFLSLDTLPSSDINAGLPFLAMARFFVVAIGGTLLGIIMATIATWVTKHTPCVPVLEPIVVFCAAYLSYILSELLTLSGIMAILFCGMIMSRYVEANISRKSHSALKYFLKMLSMSAETILFLILGVQIVTADHLWDTAFVLLTYTFCIGYRFIIITILSNLANLLRPGNQRINKRSIFTMSYGGLRGAIAFALAFNLPDGRTRSAILTATQFVIVVTVFVHGATMKPVLNYLNVRRASERRYQTVTEQVLCRGLNHVLDGVSLIVGEVSVWSNLSRALRHFDNHLQNFLVRGPHVEERMLIESLERLRELDAKNVLAEKDRKDYLRAHKAVHTLTQRSGVDLRHVLKKFDGELHRVNANRTIGAVNADDDDASTRLMRRLGVGKHAEYASTYSSYSGSDSDSSSSSSSSEGESSSTGNSSVPSSLHSSSASNGAAPSSGQASDTQNGDDDTESESVEATIKELNRPRHQAARGAKFRRPVYDPNWAEAPDDDDIDRESRIASSVLKNAHIATQATGLVGIRTFDPYTTQGTTDQETSSSSSSSSSSS